MEQVVMNEMMHQQSHMMRIARNQEGTVAPELVPHVLREQQVGPGEQPVHRSKPPVNIEGQLFQSVFGSTTMESDSNT
jgi:hypothetical protein